jgi:signal transduction histidine kinase
MKIKHFRQIRFVSFLIIAFIMVFALGLWWMNLVTNLIKNPLPPELHLRYLSMIRWEGITFLFFICLLFFLLLFLLYQNHLKNLTLSSFFASLNHELKTPLTTIKLQTQIMDYQLQQNSIYENYSKYLRNIQSCCYSLETGLNKLFEASLLTNNHQISLEKISIIDLLIKTVDEINESIDVKLKIKIENQLTSQFIFANEFYFKSIFRNLLENTVRHRDSAYNQNEVIITFSESDKNFLIKYNDQGKKWLGELKKLGSLFYKVNSPKGSGLGLFIIQTMMNKMNGRINFSSTNNLVFELILNK